jgi:nucleoside-diphosphate-sugar epimerase
VHYLVTGANGFIGRSLCRALLDAGHAVRGSMRSGRHVQEGVEPFLVATLSGATDWAPALSDIDVVIHLAARVHIVRERALNPLAEFRKVNVEGTLRLARQAAASGVKRFVFLSTVGVNGNRTAPDSCFRESDHPEPHNDYSLSKYEAEEMLLRMAAMGDMEIVIVRPPLVYGYGAPGNLASLIRWIKRRIPLPLDISSNRRSFVSVQNLVDFVCLCSVHPAAGGEIFLINDGQDLSTKELVIELASAAGGKARLVYVPLPLLRMLARLAGRSEQLERLCGDLRVDGAKARYLLGWSPPISVKAGLHQAVTGRVTL